jgi:hypothetical protein
MSTGVNRRVCLVALALASWGIGCKSADMPADPMFISRKPVEAKPETAAPVMVAYAEPVLPPDPVMVVIAPPASVPEVAQPSNKPSGKPGRKVPGILTNQSVPENNAPLLQVIPPTLPPKPQPE